MFGAQQVGNIFPQFYMSVWLVFTEYGILFYYYYNVAVVAVTRQHSLAIGCLDDFMLITIHF
jgi:hypothetical protein